MKHPEVDAKMKAALGLDSLFLFLLISSIHSLDYAWAVTPVAREIWALFDIILTIGIITGVIVIGALVYVVIRFRETTTPTK